MQSHVVSDSLGDEAIATTDSTPDESWELDRLASYAKLQLMVSGHAEEEALLQSHKSAVALFWAGCALKYARDKKKEERHGAWTEWKRDQSLRDTSVNDAIRLYENAKTEDSLIGLGITEAKAKFVYPHRGQSGDDVESDNKKSLGEDEGTAGESVSQSVPSAVTKKSHQGSPSSKTPQAESKESVADGTQAEDDAHNDPTDDLAMELKEIAQRLAEIAQNDLGTVEDVLPILSTLTPLLYGVRTLLTEVIERLPHA